MNATRRLVLDASSEEFALLPQARPRPGSRRFPLLVALALLALEMIDPFRRGSRDRAAMQRASARLDVLIALAMGAAGVLAGIAHASDPARPSNSAAIHSPPEALIEAASIPAGADVSATGDQAKTLNAALPFTAAPEPARPFLISGTALEKARALLCLTQAVYYEAGSEPIEGRRAVAQVVLNRVRHPAFPNSVCGVVYQGAASGTCQFSFVCNGDLDRPPAPGAWAEAERVADAALSGYVEASVGEATHYHADYVAPRWAPMLAKVAVIGHHIFYRWPGVWGERSAFAERYAGEPQGAAALRAAAAQSPPEAVDSDFAGDGKAARASRRASYAIASLLDSAAPAGQVPEAAVSSAQSGTVIAGPASGT